MDSTLIKIPPLLRNASSGEGDKGGEVKEYPHPPPGVKEGRQPLFSLMGGSGRDNKSKGGERGQCHPPPLTLPTM